MSYLQNVSELPVTQLLTNPTPANLVMAHTVCSSCPEEDDTCRDYGSLFTTCTEPCPRYSLTKQHVFHETEYFFLGLFDKRNKDLRGPQCQITSSWCPKRILFLGTSWCILKSEKDWNCNSSIPWSSYHETGRPTQNVRTTTNEDRLFPPLSEPSSVLELTWILTEPTPFLMRNATIFLPDMHQCNTRHSILKKEIAEYCDSDVDILKRVCL